MIALKQLRRQNAYINNLGLREADARIISVRAIEADAQVDASYSAWPSRPGQMPLKRLRRSKKIQVQFMIRELYDLAARNAVLDAVNAWARDGVLEISARPDKMAQVIVTKYANAADIRNYTDAYTVEFEACGVPFWQDKTPARLELSGTEGSGSLVVGGNVGTVLEAQLTPTEGTLGALTITATGADGRAASFAFSGLNVASGTTLTITHDAWGVLRIYAGDAGLMGKRAPESADELTISPGAATVAFEADTTVGAVFLARGWYR